MTKGVVFCPVCQAPIQRMMSPRSTVEDGLKAHMRRVHPDAYNSDGKLIQLDDER